VFWIGLRSKHKSCRIFPYFSNASWISSIWILYLKLWISFLRHAAAENLHNYSDCCNFLLNFESFLCWIRFLTKHESYRDFSEVSKTFWIMLIWVFYLQLCFFFFFQKLNQTYSETSAELKFQDGMRLLSTSDLQTSEVVFSNFGPVVLLETNQNLLQFWGFLKFVDVKGLTTSELLYCDMLLLQLNSVNSACFHLIFGQISFWITLRTKHNNCSFPSYLSNNS